MTADSKDSNATCWGTFISFYNALTKNPFPNHVDRLYYLYRMEHMFSIGLAECISQNIIHLKNSKQKKPYPDGKNDFIRLAPVGKLPNVFSRYLYLQFACDAIGTTVDINNNFFDHLTHPEALMHSINISSREFPFYEWQSVFEKFCHLFSDFVFPVFEWYFLLTLFDTADYHSETRNETAHNKLLILQQLLAEYIEQHHKIIENPLYGEKNRAKNLLCNYDDSHIIHPSYCQYDHDNIPEISFVSKGPSSSPDIAGILTALKPFDTYHNLPMPDFNKNFCYSSNPEDVAYKRFLGQFITEITT